MTKWAWVKFSAAVAVAVLLLIGILQNLADAKVCFLFWELHFPLAVLVIIVLLIGGLFGLFAAIYLNAPAKPKKPKVSLERPGHKEAGHAEKAVAPDAAKKAQPDESGKQETEE